MSKIINVMEKMNWELLRNQKATLIELSKKHPDLDGVVALIDAIQDAAVDDCIVTEEWVFGGGTIDNQCQ